VTVRTFSLLIALLHCLLLLPAQAGDRANTRFELPAAAGGTAVLEFAAAPLVTMTVTPFRLDLKNADGTPLTGAAVHCGLTMPSMPMPENRPKVSERDGAYVGELIFTCTQGAWRFTCVVGQPDGQQQTLAFDIPRVRLK
jgi:hypothetical protein